MFPAMPSINHTKILQQHLNIIRKAREVFIMNENSEKIRRELRHNVRTSNDNIFISGDSVYYKCVLERTYCSVRKKWTTSSSETQPYLLLLSSMQISFWT